MSNLLTIGERPDKKNIELLGLTRKFFFWRLWRGKYDFKYNIDVCCYNQIADYTVEMNNQGQDYTLVMHKPDYTVEKHNFQTDLLP